MMLSYALAIAVAITSLALFTTAFLMSDIHRQDDFLWSGIGLFYALILWFCARNITGAVLLGQAAATTLLLSYSWQTLKLRKALAHPERATEINNFSILRSANKLIKRDRSTASTPVESSTTFEDKVTDEIAIPDASTKSNAAKPKKSGGLGRFFSKKKSTITNTKLDEILVDEAVNQPEAKTTSKPTSSPEVATPPVVPVPTSSEPASDVTQPATLTETKLESTKVSSESTKQTEPAIDKTSEVAKAKQPPVVGAEAAAVKPQAKQPDVAIEESVAENTEVKTEEEKAQQPSVIIEEVEQAQEKPIIQPMEAKIPAAVETTIAEPQASEAQSETQSETQLEETLQKETDSQPKAKTPPTLDKIKELPQPEVESEVKPEVLGDRPDEKSETSALDALETVEVAEVLDAVPDENYGDRDLDRANIIEVTTTDISITTEVRQIDPENQKDQNTPDN